jgi:hypothetical protein
MSQHLYNTTTTQDVSVTVMMGYDRGLNYVFCVVEDGSNEPLYSNLSDPGAGTPQKDINYFRAVLEKLGIEVPDSVFRAVEDDQRARVGNSIVVHPPQERDQ